MHIKPVTKSLIQILSDGEFHSGTELGKIFNLTRSAIWKTIKQLEKYGIEVEAKTKHGYRITKGLELLDKKLIAKHLNNNYGHALQSMIIIDSLPSTNLYLSELTKVKSNKTYICLAEHQTAGKGRMGRQWISPYARNIYLSILWKFHQDISSLSGLSIATAIAAIETLKDYGIKDQLMLKWPNDILWKQHKLAGILVEISGESHNVYNAIIGIGINVDMPIAMGQKITQPWCDITQITNSFPERNKLVGILLSHILETIEIYQKQGLTAFVKKWKKLDICYHNPIKIITANGIITGIGQGIDKRGYFLLQKNNGEIKSFATGEVSLSS